VWSEPLTPASTDRDAHTFDTIVRDASGKPVAAVRCIVNRQARTGFFGEMRIDDDAGGPRQKARALVLMTREALAHAAQLGIQHVRTELPQRMQAFAERISGRTAQPLAGADYLELRGDLATIRTHALENSDADGDLA
jgi:hypothetical protein